MYSRPMQTSGTVVAVVGAHFEWQLGGRMKAIDDMGSRESQNATTGRSTGQRPAATPSVVHEENS